MESNFHFFHFNISTNDGNYEFNVLPKGNDLSSGYSIIPANERDLSIIKDFFEQAKREGSLTLDTLASRFCLLPEVLLVTSDKTHNVGIPTILHHSKMPTIHSASIKEVAASIENTLKSTCPNGAGSIVMISRPGEGSVWVSAGTRSVGGSKLNGQTAALIGSASKIFTSLCCMALIHKGAVNKNGKPLTLDTKIADIFSDKQMLIFEDQDKAKELTLGMLLSHTSGLVYFANDNQDKREGMSLSEILDAKEPGSVKFYGHPGDKIYSYSNHIGLVAAMLEIAFEKPYGEILKDELLAPLGMDRTSYECPNDGNVLLAYEIPSPDEIGGSPSSVKKEVKDPMMQGAGGLWSCMDDIEKLGSSLGLALSGKLDLIDQREHVVIGAAKLQSMMQPQTINGHCGFAFDLEGDVIGKGGGIHGYDFKFKIDMKSGSCISTMCNHAGKGKFADYLKITSNALNPGIPHPQTSKTSPVHIEVKDLPIEECSQRFKGFAGCLAFPGERPIKRINFNGTTLPVEEKKSQVLIEELTEVYSIVGDSPFQGTELQIYQLNQHLYPCLSKDLEVWSFGETIGAEFPVVTSKEISEEYASASGNYIDPTVGGPPPRQIRVDPDKGLTLSFPNSSPAKCLITARSKNEVSFVACLDGGPQDCSYKLIKNEMSDWNLVILNAETDDPIILLPQTRV